MNKREFICRTAIAIFSSMPITPDDAWDFAETLWDERPQWMKDEDQLAEDAKQGYFKGKLIARLTPEERTEYDAFMSNPSAFVPDRLGELLGGA